MKIARVHQQIISQWKESGEIGDCQAVVTCNFVSLQLILVSLFSQWLVISPPRLSNWNWVPGRENTTEENKIRRINNSVETHKHIRTICSDDWELPIALTAPH